MKASIQDKIAPIINKITKPEDSSRVRSKMGSVGGDIDFRSLLLNSNSEESVRKMATKTGDLSGAKSYQDFLESLNRQTESKRVPKNKLDKSDFLKLFITQLQNQDPLKPKDGTEMASQLAQFNGLEQMMNVNKSLVSLKEVTQKGQNFNLLNSIGKHVFVKDAGVRVDQGQAGELSIDLKQPLSNAFLVVKDDSGVVLSKKPLGFMDVGKHNLNWDAKLENGSVFGDGKYHLSVVESDKDGVESSYDVFSRVQVRGLDFQSDEAMFETDLGRLSLSEISSFDSEHNSNKKVIELGSSPKKKALETSVPNAVPNQSGHTEGGEKQSPMAKVEPLIENSSQKVASEDAVALASKEALKAEDSLANPQIKSPFSNFSAAQP